MKQYSTILDSAPPHDADAERALLGAVILSPGIIADLADVRPSDFHAPDHRAVFGAMRKLSDDGKPIDLALLLPLLKQTEDGDRAAALLAELSRGTPSAANWKHYRDRVREVSARRKMRYLAERLLVDSANGKAPGDAADDALQVLEGIAAGAPTKVDIDAPISAEQLITNNPHLHEPVIHGLLRRGETGNFISKSKVGKSWLKLHLCLCIASGRPFLGTFECRQGPVLDVDNELHPATMAHRIWSVAQAMELRPADYQDNFRVLSLRGKNLDLFGTIRLLDRIEPGEFNLITYDAFYRGIPEGASENSNPDITRLYNAIDAATARLDCAWVNIHHATKGGQADKDVTDIGSGAGAQSRATDCHIVLRPHEEENAAVLEAALRSFPPVNPLAIRWNFPLWTPDDSLDVGKLKGRLNVKEQKQIAADQEGKDKILEALKLGPATVRALRRIAGLGKSKCERLLDALESDGRIVAQEIDIRGNLCRQYELAQEVAHLTNGSAHDDGYLNF